MGQKGAGSNSGKKNLGDEPCAIEMRFIKSRHSSPGQGLFLVSLGDEFGSGASFRQNGEWIELKSERQEDRWFFEGAENELAASAPFFFDVLPRLGAKISLYLQKAAIQWFDSEGRGVLQTQSAEEFCTQSSPLELYFDGPQRCYLELATDKALWAREGGSWELKKRLSVRDVLERLTMNVGAKNQLEAAMEFDLGEGADPNLAFPVREAEIGVALTGGGAVSVIPTFEPHVIALDNRSLLTWESARPFLSLKATARFACGPDGHVSGLHARQGRYQWSRGGGLWEKSMKPNDHVPTDCGVALDRLPEAVRWWDNLTAPASRDEMGSFGAPNRIAFVTDPDPYEAQDFQLLDLVLGALDSGFGFRRRSGHWEEEYIDALDVENHMPVDEGDLRPWGGLYLHDLSESAAVLAQEFWDYGRRGFHSQSCRWSDFADWIGIHVGR